MILDLEKYNFVEIKERYIFSKKDYFEYPIGFLIPKVSKDKKFFYPWTDF